MIALIRLLKVITMASAVYTSTALLTNPIPMDGTPILASEGTEIMSAEFAASSATSEVIVTFSGSASHAVSDNGLVAALFIDDEPVAWQNGIANPPGKGYIVPISFQYTFIPGDTAAHTFKVRSGPTAGDMRYNAVFSSGSIVSFGGGASKATLTVVEGGETTEAIGQWRMVTPDHGVSGRDGAGVVSYRGDLYSLGGWDAYANPTTNNDFLKSTDGGKTWIPLPAPPWVGRHTVGWGVFNDKITVVGGDANRGYYIKGIWTWTPEEGWIQTSAAMPWESPARVLFHTVFLPDRILVIGGQTLDEFVAPGDKVFPLDPFYADVWETNDLVTATKLTDNNIWAPCATMIGQAVLDDRVYMVCGGNYETAGYPRAYADKFYSAPLSDMSDWRLEPAPPCGGSLWSSLTVFRGEIWKIGGVNANGNLAEAWRFKPGRGWLPVSAPFAPRHAHSAFVHDGALKLMYGPLDDRALWEMR